MDGEMDLLLFSAANSRGQTSNEASDASKLNRVTPQKNDPDFVEQAANSRGQTSNEASDASKLNRVTPQNINPNFVEVGRVTPQKNDPDFVEQAGSTRGQTSNEASDASKLSRVPPQKNDPDFVEQAANSRGQTSNEASDDSKLSRVTPQQNDLNFVENGRISEGEQTVRTVENDAADAISDDFVRLYVRTAERALAERGVSSLYGHWMSEASALKEDFPEFDLRAEAKNGEFVGLLSAGVLMKSAYIALHHDEILKKAVSDAEKNAAKTAAEQALKNVRANGLRPSENGISGRAAVVSGTDVGSLSGSDIRSILKQVSGGMKISF